MGLIYPPGYKRAMIALQRFFLIPPVIGGLAVVSFLIFRPAQEVLLMFVSVSILTSGPLYLAVFLAQKRNCVLDSITVDRERFEIQCPHGVLSLSQGQQRRLLPGPLTLMPFSEVIRFETKEGPLDVDLRALARAMGASLDEVESSSAR